MCGFLFTRLYLSTNTLWIHFKKLNFVIMNRYISSNPLKIHLERYSRYFICIVIFFLFLLFFFIQHLPREYQRYQFNKSSNKFQLLSRKKIITQQKIYHSVYPHSDKLPTSSSPSLFVTFNKNIIARERNAAKQTFGISCIRINTYEIPCILD